MAESAANRAVRAVNLFHNNRSQALRSSAESECSGSRVPIQKDGGRLIAKPEPRLSLIDTLRGLAPLDPDEAFPDDLHDRLLSFQEMRSQHRGAG